MSCPTFPLQDPMTSEFREPMGLIAVELTIKALYEDHDRRKRNNENAKTVASQIQSVRFNLSAMSN
jgi:hypothetical protein